MSRLPVSIRIVLEAVLRNCDGKKVTESHIGQLANWQPNDKRVDEIPFIVARVVLQDFTGVPLLADLAAMRSVADKLGKSPKRIEPLVPVDLVVDHSVMIDHYGTRDALDLNMKLEFSRNKERYQFMKWGMQAFDTFKVVPPGIGIVHQVNLEYLARGVHKKKDGDDVVYYPDTLVGTDSHTTMINGIGVVGWGVGGIEAEAGMLGQPVYFLTPDVVGVHLKGRLREGVTATDLVLRVTELLRAAKVVGKFVEFFGEGTESLALPDRATIGNMAPEYGATMGFFPVDEQDDRLLQGHRPQRQLRSTPSRATSRPRGCSACPKAGTVAYSQEIELDLGDRVAVAGRPEAAAGPHRTRQHEGELRVALQPAGAAERLQQGPPRTCDKSYETGNGISLKNGDMLIAAITSCTNTSNPSVLLAAGLLAKKAVERGLTVKPHIKTSLAPGSRVVTDYLTKTGLLPYLGKTRVSTWPPTAAPPASATPATCVRSSTRRSIANDMVCAAVLSGNRNFEARIHPNIRANFLASPPLVVAYALAGTVQVDLMTEPVGKGKDGKDVYLGDIWPSSEEVQRLLRYAMDPKTFKRLYSDLTKDHTLWNKISSTEGQVYNWPDSTYIAEPPFFEDFEMSPAATAGGQGRPHPGLVRRLDHDRPHLAGRARSRTRRPRAST